MIILLQREFARADYEGLTKKGQEELKKARIEAAKILKEDRKFYQSFKNDVRNNGYTTALNKARAASNAEKVAQILAGETASPEAEGFFKRNKKLLIGSGIATLGTAAAATAVHKYKQNKKD